MTGNVEEHESPKKIVKESNLRRILKITIASFLLTVLILVIVDSVTTKHVRDLLQRFLIWIENNPVLGVFAFTLVYMVSTVLFIPGAILTLGAGFVFANAYGLALGVLLGTLSVFVGASTGAILSFLISRYVCREWAKRLFHSFAIFEAIDSCMADKGFRIMALLRLSPIVPFTPLNYVAGVTSISFWHNTLAMLFMLPGTVLYVFLGASAGSLADSSGSGGNNKTVTIVVIVLGTVFGVAALWLTSHYARKELNHMVEARQTQVDQGSIGCRTFQNGTLAERAESV